MNSITDNKSSKKLEKNYGTLFCSKKHPSHIVRSIDSNRRNKIENSIYRKSIFHSIIYWAVNTPVVRVKDVEQSC